MSVFSFHARLSDHPIALYMSGCIFLLLSAFLLLEHVIVVQQVASLQLPVLADIPVLQQQARILEDQIRVAEMQSFLLGNAEEELVRMYVIPNQADYHRILGFFSVLEQWIQEHSSMKDTVSLHIGEPHDIPVPLSDGSTEILSVHPLTVTIETSQEMVDDISHLIQLAGFLSVGDILREKELLKLLIMTEEENPSGIVTMEHFFGADLLEYSQNPHSFEEQIRRSFVSEALLATFAHMLKTSLEPIHLLLAGRAGQLLESSDMWPSRLFVMQSIASRMLPNERIRLHMKLEAYSRS
ncbi:hypothetical protein A3D11_03555 [Candidatus Peribacteria bacterium RIFCSPHIGHO2_02_FULL_49_16]|nr:MAG: hypothetical protein A2880_04515 [Candidatus Peribacteria bacterium RIFCSPHIGHO2_01_FULL_49_38]OGJ58811.1 MAG: hypothetical protein A3D11_03555 [Candidatus Peribacteria bacterium RIFCSPHIGHO2_02_FULL_49_16]